MAERVKVGSVFSFFGKIGVAAVNLSDGGLKVGDKVQVQGATTDLVFTLDSMQIERQPVAEASKGQSVGIKVPDKVRPNDVVYRVSE
jgi:putative protease